MIFPDDIRCRCGQSVSTVSTSDAVSAECLGCGRKAGPCGSPMSLYATWYGLVPMRTASENIGRAISAIIMSLADNGSYVLAGDLVKLAEDEATGRRSINILADTGLIRPKYIVEDDEVTFEEAVRAKGEGKKLSVYFRKSFSREN